jgi:O-antigen ligase
VLPLQTLRYQIQGYPLGAQIVDVVLLGILIGVWMNRTGPEFSEFPMRGVVLVVTAYSYLSLWYGAFSLGWGWPTSLDDPRFSEWRNWAEFGVICLLSFLAIKTREQIQTVLLLMCVTAFLLSWDFFQILSSQDISHYSWTLRYSGVLGYANANGLAAFEAMFILLLLGLLGPGLSPKLKLMIPPTLFACGYGLLFAFSRGAYMGVALGVIALGVLRKKFFTVLILTVLAGAFLLPSAVSDRIAGTYVQGTASEEKTLDSSAMDRVLIWQNALDIIAAHPLVGTGFDTYAFMHPLGFRDTHNLYLKVLLEQGAVGLLIFFVLLWKMLRQGYDLFRRSTDPFLTSLGVGFTASVLGAIVVNIFGDRWSYLQVDSYLWIVLALVCRGRLLSSEPQTEIEGAASVPLHPAPALAT